MKRSLVAVVLLAVIAASASPQNRKKRTDPRLIKALDSQKFDYKIGEDSRVRATFQVKEGTDRTHQIIIDSTTSSLWGLEVRQVWAYAYKVDGDISPRLAYRLLEENGRKTLGAWELLRENGISTVIFTAKVSADIDGPMLRTVIGAVIEEADGLEEELTQKDDL